jgi:uncharacterized protein (DUF169 family)
MPKFEKQVKQITQTLCLESIPIGGKFSERPHPEGVSRKLSICEAFNVVRQENVVVNLSKESCTCAGGRHFAGLEILPLETMAGFVVRKGHKVYETKKIAEASASKQPQPVFRGRFLVLGPLDMLEANPDVVLFFVNPAQADRILGLTSFKGVEPFLHYPATSICSTITHVLASGRPSINFISMFERQAGKWSPNELMIALPFKDFLTAVKSIPHSGYGSLPHPE